MSKYVGRDGQGNVTGAFTAPQPEVAEELLADDDADLVAYMERAFFRQSPRDFGAELDALKKALIGKNVLAEKDIADAAEVAQSKA